MEGFLTFLSNHYIYFLIAAGVLLFALLGFVFDLKKRKETPEVSEEEIPNVAPEPEVNNQENLTVDNMNVGNGVPSEEINPAPPMPVENEVQVNNTPTVENNAQFEQPVMTNNTPVNNPEPMPNIVNNPVQQDNLNNTVNTPTDNTNGFN
jgi:hypothetical protein